MAEPKWLTMEMALAIQDEQLALFGGAQGLRDQGLLENALSRPQNRFHYDPHASLFELAAAYCYGVVKNHPFMDGDKRTGLLCIQAFLVLNGYSFDPDQAQEVTTILALAAGEVEEDQLARWIKDNASKA